MIGVDVFSGVGGISLGALIAGIAVKLAVEIDKYAAEAFLANHKGVVMFKDDIRNLKEFPSNKTNKPTVLFGGPPCQGFSYEEIEIIENKKYEYNK